MKGYRLSETADSHLRDIWRFTSAKWSQRQADEYLQELEYHLQKALATPALLRTRPELGTGLFACAAGSHIIYGVEADEEFLVVAILHSRMDPRRHLLRKN